MANSGADEQSTTIPAATCGLSLSLCTEEPIYPPAIGDTEGVVLANDVPALSLIVGREFKWTRSSIP